MSIVNRVKEELLLRKYGVGFMKDVMPYTKVRLTGEFSEEEVLVHGWIHMYTDGGKNVGDKLDLYGDKRSILLSKYNNRGRVKTQKVFGGLMDFMCKYIDDKELKANIEEMKTSLMEDTNTAYDKFFSDSAYRDQKFEEYKTDFLPKLEEMRKTSIVDFIKQYKAKN